MPVDSVITKCYVVLVTYIYKMLTIPDNNRVHSVYDEIKMLHTGETLNPNRWMEHLEKDLLPYWTTGETIGVNGNFPNFRYKDGSIVNPIMELKDEYKQLERVQAFWITNRLGRTYIRMISRQAYLYGIAYHITGKEEILKLAKKMALFL